MRFEGVVSENHIEAYGDFEGGLGWEMLDVSVDVQQEGHEVTMDIVVPLSEAANYRIGRRVAIEVTPL